MLNGFWVAEQIHNAQDEWAFHHLGPFSTWLWQRLGMKYPSALGWAAEIERVAEVEGKPGTELFFELLDEFRAEQTDASALRGAVRVSLLHQGRFRRQGGVARPSPRACAPVSAPLPPGPSATRHYG